MNFRAKNLIEITVGIVLLGCYAVGVFGQTDRTWDGGDKKDEWSKKKNWSGDSEPDGVNDRARFSGGNAGTSLIEIDKDSETGGMLFDANLTIDITFEDGGKELLILNGGANFGITNNSTRTITFESEMAIDTAMTFATTNASGGGLIFEAELDTDGSDLTFGTTNAANFIDVSGEISGGGGINKTGAGILTLSGDNSFTGAINVSGGVLSISSQENLGDLGASSNLTLNGGTLRIDGGTVDNDDNTRVLVLGAGGGTIDTVAGSDTLIWDNNISGSGDLTKTGDGTFRFDDPTTFTGDLNINEGTVEFGGGDNRLVDSVDVTIASGATLDVRDRSDDFGSLSGAGTLTSSNSTTEIVGFGLNNTDTEFSGTITEGLNIEKLGSGNMTLSGNNTFTGTTTVVAGTLTLANSNALGTAAGNTTINSGATLSLTNDINVASEAIANNGTIVNTSGDNTIGGVISGSGGVEVNADSLTLSADNTYTGDTNVNAGSLLIAGQTDSLNINIASGAELEFNVANGTRTNDANTNFTGTGTLAKTGAGELRWNSAVVDFALGSGALIDVREGTLRGAAGGNDTWTNNLSDLNVEAGATFNGAGLNMRVDAITGDGTIQHGFVNPNRFTFGVDNGTGTFTGVMEDFGATGPGEFTKVGTGTQTLSGNSTFTGTMEIEEGILVAASNNALGSTVAGTSVDSGAQLQLASAAIGNEALTLNGSGVSSSGALQALSGTNSWAGTITLASNSEINAASGANLTVSGAINGIGRTLTVDGVGNSTFSGLNQFATLDKQGAGNLTLSGSNKTIGTMNVTAGTVTLASSGILDNGMDLNVSGGAFTTNSSITETIADLNFSSGELNIGSNSNLTIDSGTISGGDLNIATGGILTMNGGTISGGDGSGSDGKILLTAGAGVADVDRNILNVTENFDFGGTLELSANTTLVLAGGHTFNLGTLNVTGDTVIDFGDGTNNTFNLDSLTIANGVEITVKNWISFQDLWTTDVFNGNAFTVDVRDGNTAQIKFTGFEPEDTIWLENGAGDYELTVPEPSSYGAILMGFGLVAWRLRRPRRQIVDVKRA